MENVKQIIWDWNGTLLNDMEMCVEVINEMLPRYNLKTLSIAHYKEVFGFPVKDYYKKIGFNFDQNPFEVVGLEFMDSYFKKLDNCPLFEEAIIVLEYFEKKGLNQLVLSAMEDNALEKNLEQKGIRHFFNRVQGINNHLASGKEELAKGLIKKSGFSASESLVIGDTLHDLQVAKAIGSPCVLIAQGHISKERLIKEHPLVFDSLSDFLNYYKADFQFNLY